MGTQGHLPFGDSWYSTGSVDEWKFTSYERDSDTLLDYALMRFDSARLARFLTPDPSSASINRADPQSWNRYAYVTNDPINAADPTGLAGQCRPNICEDPHQDDDLARMFNYSCGTIEGMPVPCQFFNAIYATGATVKMWCDSWSGCGNVQARMDGKIYQYTWIPKHNESSGIVDPTCDGSLGPCASDVLIKTFWGHWDWVLVGFLPGHDGEMLSLSAQAVLTHPILRTAAATMNDPRTIAGWYGASAVAGLMMFPSAALEMLIAGKDAWLTFEYMWPGATEDMLNILTPGLNIPVTEWGAALSGALMGQEVYDWYTSD